MEQNKNHNNKNKTQSQWVDPLDTQTLPKNYYEAGFQEKVATKLHNIMEWIRQHQKGIFGSFLIKYFKRYENISNLIGKKYHNKLSKSYLRRLDPNNNDQKHGRGAKFSLWRHITKPNVLLFQAVKSKFKSAVEYQVVLSLEEANEYFKAQERYKLETKYQEQSVDELKQKIKEEFPALNITQITSKPECIQILNEHLEPTDPINDHWYSYMKTAKSDKLPVSSFLHDKNKLKIDLLRKKLVQKYNKDRKNGKYYIDGLDISKLKKQQLYEYMLSRDLFPKGENKKSLTYYTKTKLLQIAAQQIEPLIKEQEIDCNFDKLWATRNTDEEKDYTLSTWAYQHGLLTMWRDKVYKPMNSIYVSNKNKKNTNAILHMTLPVWRPHISRHKQAMQTFKPVIQALWKIFIQQKWLYDTLVLCKMNEDGDDNANSNVLLKKIIKSYMENPLTIESMLYHNDEHDPEHKLPPALEYLKTYPKYSQPKHWHDINFDLWITPLARVQMTCSCKAGEQLPSCCAHCSTILWLMHYSITCTKKFKEVLAEHSKDIKIKQHLIDLIPHHNYKKAKAEALSKNINKQQDKTNYYATHKICLCNQITDEKLIKCLSCNISFHPSCVGQSWDEIYQFSRVLSYWRCPTCSNESYFIHSTYSHDWL